MGRVQIRPRLNDGHYLRWGHVGQSEMMGGGKANDIALASHRLSLE